ncbi:hypothetical protein T440DRAFT_317022 [Plenodomus tracheiphilus IPT5]|uniref:DUF676 domain-containing protein n=1 Tax=Plenodomus tracheiphilus IPT5 TaxID=1408161 RepID=A0A6A7AN43_9PLEO|nr:hypothetical protein T440DRAFT_317022 [Plenodomus tracheiphilus IPT5]
MATVHRLSFTRLAAREQDDQVSLNIVFVHGLRGHPRETWEAATTAIHSSSSDTTKKPYGFRSLFKRRLARSSAINREQAHSPSSNSVSFSPPSTTTFWSATLLLRVGSCQLCPCWNGYLY